VVAKLQLFTEPISVFTREDEISVAACYSADQEMIYALATNDNLSLLYRVDLNASQLINQSGLHFEQIITITHATKLLMTNARQLVAASKTQLCVFSQDSSECDHLKPLF
jgi:hypothetical protein